MDVAAVLDPPLRALTADELLLCFFMNIGPRENVNIFLNNFIIILTYFLEVTFELCTRCFYLLLCVSLGDPTLGDHTD